MSGIGTEIRVFCYAILTGVLIVAVYLWIRVLRRLVAHRLCDYGAKEVHMRIACPPLIYGCPFIGFTSSKSDLELITRRMIKEIEGDENKNLEKYATTDSPEYKKMVQMIADRFGLSSLKFNTLETLVEAIGLPKCKVCTHCFDGSSCF